MFDFIVARLRRFKASTFHANLRRGEGAHNSRYFQCLLLAFAYRCAGRMGGMPFMQVASVCLAKRELVRPLEYCEVGKLWKTQLRKGQGLGLSVCYLTLGKLSQQVFLASQFDSLATFTLTVRRQPRSRRSRGREQGSVVMLSALRVERISLMGMLADAEGAQELARPCRHLSALEANVCREQVCVLVLSCRRVLGQRQEESVVRKHERDRHNRNHNRKHLLEIA